MALESLLSTGPCGWNVHLFYSGRTGQSVQFPCRCFVFSSAKLPEAHPSPELKMDPPQKKDKAYLLKINVFANTSRHKRWRQILSQLWLQRKIIFYGRRKFSNYDTFLFLWWTHQYVKKNLKHQKYKSSTWFSSGERENPMKPVKWYIYIYFFYLPKHLYSGCTQICLCFYLFSSYDHLSWDLLVSHNNLHHPAWVQVEVAYLWSGSAAWVPPGLWAL